MKKVERIEHFQSGKEAANGDAMEAWNYFKGSYGADAARPFIQLIPQGTGATSCSLGNSDQTLRKSSSPSVPYC